MKQKKVQQRNSVPEEVESFKLNQIVLLAFFPESIAEN